MKEQIKNKILNLTVKEVWPLMIVLTGLLLSASITYASFSFSIRKEIIREVIVEKPVETEAVLGLEAIPSAVPAQTPSFAPSYAPIIITTPKPSIKSSSTPAPSPSAENSQKSSTQNPTPIIVQIIATPTPSISPSPLSSPNTEPSPSPVAQKVAIQIKQPDAQINFDLVITEGINVCQAMHKAEDEGKISSLTISDKYLESFSTLLIEEINGFKNNWVFTVNGESPKGCSLVTLKNGDKIAWEFLSL